MAPTLRTVATGSDLYDILHEKLGLTTVGSPCPYCGEGEDRFVYLSGDHDGRDYSNSELAVRFMCRTQARRPPEKRTHKPIVSAAELLRDKFDTYIELAPDVTWGSIADTMPYIKGSGGRGTPSVLSKKLRIVSPRVVAEQHLEGIDYWRKNTVFDDLTIHTFRLGIDVWTNGYDRLTIPIRLPVEWTGKEQFILKGRKLNPRDPSPRKYDLPDGAPPVLYEMWRGRDGKMCFNPDAVVIGEGEKSTMALWQMGFAPVATTTAGAGTWMDHWTEDLLGRQPKSLILVGDDDDAGDSFVRRIYTSIQRVAKNDDEFDLEGTQVLIVRWPNFGDATDRSKTDPYDILEQYGAVEAAKRIRDMLVDADALLNPRPERMKVKLEPVVSLEDLRGDGSDSLYQRMSSFVRGYRKEFYDRGSELLDVQETGTVLVERTAPGVGKTHIAVQLVEEVAQEVEARARVKDAERAEKRQRAMQALADPNLPEDVRVKMERQANLPDAPRNGPLYIAPFRESWTDIVRTRKHPELWFNMEARTPDNCRYYDMQSAIASRGYTVMGRLCHGDCPFADRCKAEPGQYMQQFEEMRKYPIVFLRHPHLLMKELSSSAAMVVIDEDPHGEFLRPMEIGINDMDSPVRLSEMLADDFDHKQVRYVMALAEALEKALVSARHDDQSTMRSGPDVLRLVDVQLGTTMYGVFDLLEIVDNLDPAILERLDHRTPRELFEMDTVHTAPSGFFPKLIHLVLEEAQSYYAKVLSNMDFRWNSRVNIISRNGDPVFVFYAAEPFPIPLKVPVIALDATGSTDKYEASLERAVLDHRSLVRHPDTRTVVFTGSGFSISSIRKQADMGQSVIPVEPSEWAAQGSEETADLLDVNAAITDATKVLRAVATRHSSLLVVTYKAFEETLKTEALKSLGWDLYSRIHWGHFQALRGSNAFEDLEAVLIVGTPRPPLRDTAMMLSALFHKDPQPLDFMFGSVWVPYHSEGALPPARVKLFADKRTHNLVHEIEAGEILQCLSRIRPHTSKTGKFVYLLTDRPAAEWVTHLLPYKAVTAEYDTEFCASLIAAEGVKPTIANVKRVLAEKGVNVGERRARTIATAVKQGVNLTDWLSGATIPE